ncbi:flavocytochrome c [Spirochaeta isovalerica]|uniref:Flavocytochrome c n=1 Tax=Spirochaeta isovalerica TaxID=150 RepID=A0A841RDU8_9SPIO|nr:flavocytochrome c [Spirochaeta isovalerica]MBB6481397.1 flavocytochrome c [Spirochaeta isovalerica]
MKNKYDVIVIGSGIAGLSAAIESRLAGADVIVLEKMAGAGGNSLISDGGLAAAGTEEQKAAGIVDSPALMYYDMMKAGERINNPDLVKILTEESAEAYLWTRDFLKVPYLDRIDIFGGHSVPRCYTAENITGKTFISALLKKAEELSIPVAYKHYVQDIVREDDKSLSLKVIPGFSFKTGKGEPPEILKARKGIILAAGGFGSDVPFRSAQDPRLNESVQSTGQPFVDSSVLKMALNLGAAPVQLSRIQLGPWASPDETGYGDGPSFAEYILFQYGILIDPDKGVRFVNEMADRKTLSDEMMFMGRYSIGICDDHAVKTAGWNIDKALKKKVVLKFSTMEELCLHYGMDFIPVKRTVEQFNRFILAGKDKNFDKPILDGAKPISRPPYYGIRLYPKVHYTMGGLRIDENARVLDLNGKPVNGLYAAGEITGGVHGASRLGSCSLTDCVVFGRRAGRFSAS